MNSGRIIQLWESRGLNGSGESRALQTRTNDLGQRKEGRLGRRKVDRGKSQSECFQISEVAYCAVKKSGFFVKRIKRLWRRLRI